MGVAVSGPVPKERQPHKPVSPLADYRSATDTQPQAAASRAGASSHPATMSFSPPQRPQPHPRKTEYQEQTRDHVAEPHPGIHLLNPFQQQCHLAFNGRLDMTG